LRPDPIDFEAIVGIVPDAIVAFDDSGNISFFNPAAEQLFQVTVREARHRRVWSLLTKQGGAELAAIMAQRDSGSERHWSVTRELQAVRKDGATIPTEFRFGDISQGGNVRFVAFVRDLRERRAREGRAQRLQTELMHLSRLINMGDMASALAHELNQPLTALSAYLQGAIQLLAERKDEASVVAVDAMTKAASQVVRAADVIRRLREFVVRGETEKRAESLARMVEEAMELVTVVESRRPLDIEVALDPGADLVIANRIQIQQVLLNLIRNGLEAMKDMHIPRLVISSERIAGDMVRVKVSDRGTGIAPKVATKLFQSFVTTKQHGLGVGLSLSRTIVEAHGGKISATPNPGGGTVFQFTLRSGIFQDLRTTGLRGGA
jgi:two-component system sensor kinase FixL